MSEAEITVPHNPKPASSAPAKQHWHVHLELNPEELVALHRLGLTDGGLAWREGMEAWQPLATGQSSAGPRPEPPAEKLPKREPRPDADAQASQSKVLREQSSPSIATEAHPEPNSPSIPAEARGEQSSSSIPAEARGEQSSSSIAPDVRRAQSSPSIRAVAAADGHHSKAAPPPAVIARGKPVPATTIHPFSAAEPPPLPLPARLPFWDDSKAGGPGLSGIVPRPVAPESASPERMEMEVLRDKIFNDAHPTSVAPVAFELAAKVGLPRERARIWLGVGALVVLAAGTGALVAFFMAWNLFAKDPNSGSSSTAASVNSSTAGSVQCPVPSATPTPSLAAVAGSTQSAVSVDELPLAGRGDSSRDETVMSSAGESRREARLRRTSTAHRGSPARVVLAEDGRRATSRGSSSKPDVAKGAPGAPDLRAISRAVARATGAASSCGPGPETGRVEISFAPSGGVSGVRLLQGFGETGINACVLRTMGRAKVPAFVGAPVSIRKTVSW